MPEFAQACVKYRLGQDSQGWNGKSYEHSIANGEQSSIAVKRLWQTTQQLFWKRALARSQFLIKGLNHLPIRKSSFARDELFLEQGFAMVNGGHLSSGLVKTKTH